MNKTWVLTSKICGTWRNGEGVKFGWDHGSWEWEMRMKTQNWTGTFSILSSRTDCCPISSNRESTPALRIRKDLERANTQSGFWIRNKEADQIGYIKYTSRKQLGLEEDEEAQGQEYFTYLTAQASSKAHGGILEMDPCHLFCKILESRFITPKD